MSLALIAGLVLQLGLGGPAVAGGTGVAEQGEAGSGPAPWEPDPALVQQAIASGDAVVWSDVPRTYWAKTEIDYVGSAHSWMRDFKANADGSYPFKPDAKETRKRLARAVVKAFARSEPIDPDITFNDMSTDDPYYPFANVAVKLGWMGRTKAGNFNPDGFVTLTTVHKALLFALGLRSIVEGAEQIHTRDGVPLTVPKGFGARLVGMRLGLRYNHSDESLDVTPLDYLPRSEVAYSLYRAANAPSDVATSLSAYSDIELPALSNTKRSIVEFGMDFVGYPYVWGGEWYEKSPNGYCCGSQPVGGFDCSGLVWWVMKKVTSSWDNVPPRPYYGWKLLERSSSDMSKTGAHVKFRDLQAGDLMFYDGDGNGVVDHVDVYIGNGWSIDSSGGYGGVSFVRVDSGWYRDAFVWGRRIL
jgi:cell wall-associated NlpC family hydrolase